MSVLYNMFLNLEITRLRLEGQEYEEITRYIKNQFNLDLPTKQQDLNEFIQTLRYRE